MPEPARHIVIIGGGIAGLCTGVYAQLCGYQVTILEQHAIQGGLATSWTRNGYTFETCLSGLDRFRMGGQWVQSGGGLPCGLMTARAAVRAICRRDHVAFLPDGAGRRDERMPREIFG